MDTVGVGSMQVDTSKIAEMQKKKSATKKKKKGSSSTKTFKCVCCGKEYATQPANFSISNSPLFEGNNGYLPICKTCIEAYYNKLYGFYNGNEAKAIEHCCRIFDWYYDEDALKMLDTLTRGMSKIIGYPGRMNLKQFQRRGTTYLDTIRQKHPRGVISDKTDIVEEGQASPWTTVTEVSDGTIEFFGFGFTTEEYLFLEDQYNDWKSRYECKTKVQEEIFKNLCFTQLSLRKAQQRRDIKAITDLTKTFQDLLGTANLKPAQSKDSGLTQQNTFGTLIKKWETEKPISKPEPEWEDVDNVKKYIDTFFLGHLAKLVHLENDNSAAYEKEMGEYTVKPPQYEDDNIAETSLLDKYSDKGGKNDNP